MKNVWTFLSAGFSGQYIDNCEFMGVAGMLSVSGVCQLAFVCRTARYIAIIYISFLSCDLLFNFKHLQMS